MARYIIDDELDCIIVNDSYYTQIDKKNAIIAKAGGTKLDYTQNIIDAFNSAIKKPVIRKSDLRRK